jgi:DNA-binding transcriptional LysR family regulator
VETLRLADLQIFLEIARASSITGAAAALDVPKAGVSKALARLERRLGVMLFERNTRRLAITPAGVLLQKRAEQLTGDIEGLVEEIGRDQREVRGTLSVAAPPDLGAWLAERLFPDYLAQHPRVRLALKLDYGLHDLFDPEIDVAFRVGTIRDDTLVARQVGSIKRILVASPAVGQRLSWRKPESVSEGPCLTFSEEREPRAAWTLTDGKVSRSFEVEGRLAARSFPALLAAARAGLGVAKVAEFLAAPHIARGELVRVLPRWSSPAFPVFLLHRVGQQRVQRVAALLAFLAQRRAPVPDGTGRPDLAD